MTEPILSARAVTRVFRSEAEPLQALRGVDLDVSAGELVAIMGASGSGKSTLLHILAGLDRPTEGEIWLDGRRIDRLSETALAVLRRTRIGVVFQAFNLVSNLSVADNVELPALVAGVGAGEARKRSRDLLDRLGIADKAKQPPSRLSGGQQQRVALARALVNRPAVLLADEPTGNLDTATTRDVLRLLREANAEGQTIVMVTHDSRVASISSRILTMSDGRMVNETTLNATADAANALGRVMRVEV